MYTSYKTCPLNILLSKPQQSSHRLRWMIVCIGRHASIYALLHNSLIMVLLPHTYTQFMPLLSPKVTANEGWRTVPGLSWLTHNFKLAQSRPTQQFRGNAAPCTGLWERYISSNTARLSCFDAGDCHRGIRYFLAQQMFYSLDWQWHLCSGLRIHIYLPRLLYWLD